MGADQKARRRNNTNPLSNGKPSNARLALIEPDKPSQIKLFPATAPTDAVYLSGHLTAIKSLTFSSDGNLLISGDDSGVICEWDVRSQQLLMRWQFSRDPISDLVFFRDDRMMAAVNVSGGLAVYQVSRNRWPTVSPLSARHQRRLFGDKNAQIYATSSDESGPVFLWKDGDFRSQRKLGETLVTRPIVSLAPLGRFIAYGDGNEGYVVSDISTGARLAKLNTDKQVTSISLDEDDKLYFGTKLGEVISMNILSGKEEHLAKEENAIDYVFVRRQGSAWHSGTELKICYARCSDINRFTLRSRPKTVGIRNGSIFTVTESGELLIGRSATKNSNQP